MIRRCAFILSAALFAVGGITSYAADPTKPPPLDLKGTRILVCAGYWADMTGMPVLTRLTKAGAEVRRIRKPELTWETAQQFHVLLYVFDQAPVKTKPGVEGPDDVLRKFVAVGGGVFFFWGGGFEAQDDVNRSLAPFGAGLLKEYVQDPQNAFTSPSGSLHLPYAYTRAITPGHPLTENVTGMWYSHDFASEFSVSAIDVSKDWRVLVSGEKSATTFGITGQILQGFEIGAEQRRPGKFQSSPPILAAREFEAGAVVFTGLSGVDMFYGQGLPYYGDVAMEKGDGLRRSDFGRLYDNALVWLAQRARKSATLGQGELKPVVAPEIKKIDWNQDVLAGQQCTKPIKGVIGLHSTLSDGKATPEALIAKAKASGLQWVAFTEKLEILAAGPWNKRAFTTVMFPSAGERSETDSPDKWEQLRKICKDASTADFTALPGLDYAVNTRDRWVVFGDFEWPDAKNFSPDRQKIINPDYWFAIGTVPNGPYNAGKNARRPWNHLLYNSWPVRTTLAGTQTDESLDPYRYLHGLQDDPFPMAVDMVYDENELAAAAGRMCNFITQDKPGDLTKFFRDTHYFGSHRAFVSDGPVVTDWRCANAGRSTDGKWYVPSTEQYRVKLSVESEVPINAIKIYDGPTLFRRFCPKQPKVTVAFDVPHDKQRNLLAVITDANGKQAITGAHFIRDFLNFRFMCADRRNSICDAVLTDESGPYLVGPSAPYQQKEAPVGAVFPGYGLRPFQIIAPGVDGGLRPIGMSIAPTIFFKYAMKSDFHPIMEPRHEIPVCSRDGILQEESIVGYYNALRTTANPGWLVPMDLKEPRINYRYLNITPRPGDPGVILLEGRLGFGATKRLEGEALNIFSAAINSKPGEGDHYALVTPEQTVAGQHQVAGFQAEAPMVPGSYVMIFPAQLGSTGAMALDEGYRAVVSDGSRTYIAVRLDPARDVKAGDEIRYRLLLMHGRPNELANTADWEHFARSMGVRGKAAYEVKDVKAGKVTGTKFLLEIAPENGGFAATIPYCNLPIRLPVRVADMNPNWTFAWFDLDRKEWFPSAVDAAINQGFFTLDTRRGAHRFFAGHPVLADNKDLKIAVLTDGRSKVQASVNNVGDVAVDTAVRLNSALGKVEPVQVHLEPGEVKELEFSFIP